MDEQEIFKVISDLAEKLNYEVYIIGGYVRDLILEKRSKDIDFVIVGDAIKFSKELAKQWNNNKIVLYENFETAMIPFHSYILEFVSARAESYQKNSRNPNVEKADLKTDILRRDFTINTLAISLNKQNYGDLLDLLNGQKDIKNKIIRTPLDPEQTFFDDPLRIMRAIRFASKLNFKIEEKTYDAIIKYADRLKIISIERISDEFIKIIQSDNPSYGLQLLKETGILKVIIPELDQLEIQDDLSKGHHKNVWEHTLKVLDNVSKKSKKTDLRLAALFHDIGKFKTREYIEKKGWTFYNHDFVGSKMIIPIFKKLRLSKELTLKVKKLVALHMRPIALTEKEVTDSAIRRLIVKAGEDLDDLLILASSDLTSANPKKVAKKKKEFQKILERIKEVNEKDELRAFQSPVRGEEIMKLANIPAGPKVGFYKKQIEEAILDGIINNNYDEAKNFLLNLLKTK